MASGSSWSRFPPITLSGGTRDRFHLQDNDRYAACGYALIKFAMGYSWTCLALFGNYCFLITRSGRALSGAGLVVRVC